MDVDNPSEDVATDGNKIMEINKEMEDDDEDSSDSESESEDENEEIVTLREQVKSNPYYYDGHLKLITALRESGDLEKIRDAREQMSCVFPLTEELWLQWIRDELPLAVIPERKQYIICLFDKATKDYISVKIWTEYCQFMMDKIENKDGIEEVRNIFEKAITAVGLHLTEGSAIWEGYREFEMSILQSYQQMSDINGSSGDFDLDRQVARVTSIFKRQLSIPLLGMQQTMRDFEDWSPQPVSVLTENAYQKAMKKMEESLKYEEELNTGDSSKLTQYENYIAYEVKDGNPARIQCIFERAIRDNCLNADLWSQYTNYLDYKLKVHSVAIAAHERAVRNCPWISLLWQNYIRALERNDCEKARIKATFDQALQCGFGSSEGYVKLWLTYLDFLRRRVVKEETDLKAIEDLRKGFTNASKYMSSHFGEDDEESCSLSRFWAFCEVTHGNDLRKAQEIWDAIMKKHGREAHMWIEYTNFLRIHGDAVLARQVFQRAVQTNMDDPNQVCNAFIMFEREEGNLSQFDSAQQRIRDMLKKWSHKRQKEEENSDKTRHVKTQQVEHKRQERKRQRKEQKSEKRIPTGETSTSGADGQSKQPRNKETPSDDAEPVVKKIKGNQGSAVAEKDNDKEERVAESESTDTPTEEKKRKSDDRKTVFLSNLLFTVNEDQIKEQFHTCGDITEVRLVKNRVGKSKGYAYLEFQDESAVSKALEMDRVMLQGRPVFVSPVADKSKNPTQFKFATTLDKSTVFATNLPFDLTEEDMRSSFQIAGAIKQIRLVTNRGGKPKGYGYVEFEDESAASNAVMKLDGTELKGRVIQVALSNPPSRKPRSQDAPQEQKKSNPGSRGKASTQLAMMPRALSKARDTKPPSIPKDKDAQSSSTSSTTKMSNEDFRKLLGRKT